jgi:hypothetical protein
MKFDSGSGITKEPVVFIYYTAEANPEDRGSRFLCNFGTTLPNYTSPLPRRQES